jgi:hypothetical protein
MPTNSTQHYEDLSWVVALVFTHTRPQLNRLASIETKCPTAEHLSSTGRPTARHSQCDDCLSLVNPRLRRRTAPASGAVATKSVTVLTLFVRSDVTESATITMISEPSLGHAASRAASSGCSR